MKLSLAFGGRPRAIVGASKRPIIVSAFEGAIERNVEVTLEDYRKYKIEFIIHISALDYDIDSPVDGKIFFVRRLIFTDFVLPGPQPQTHQERMEARHSWWDSQIPLLLEQMKSEQYCELFVYVQYLTDIGSSSLGEHVEVKVIDLECKYLLHVD